MGSCMGKTQIPDTTSYLKHKKVDQLAWNHPSFSLCLILFSGDSDVRFTIISAGKENAVMTAHRSELGAGSDYSGNVLLLGTC